MKSKAKGTRAERHIVELHKETGIHAKRVPGSGAFSYTGDHDVDVYPWGEDSGALVAEVKAKQSDVPKNLITKLGENDLLFIKPDRQDPYVFMPWATYEKLLLGSNMTAAIRAVEKGRAA